MSLLNLLYPPRCYHCDTELKEKRYFCVSCTDQLTLLSPEGHCAKCFRLIPNLKGICVHCRTFTHPFSRLSACFDAYGPGTCLIKAFLGHKHYSLATEIASFMYLQLTRLRYPEFQTITMVPKFLKNPQYAVGEELSSLLGVPFIPVLKNTKSKFALKKKCNILNQVVLLVDLSMNTRETMRSAAWAIDRGYVETIYGLTFCATLH